MKKVFIFSISLVLIISFCFNVYAANIYYRYGGFEYYTEDGYGVISTYYGTETTVTVPSEILGDEINYIGMNAFLNRTDITSLNLPNTIKAIYAAAFYGCSSLERIKIPESVTAIRDISFCNCESLSFIFIPNSVTEIAKNAFEGCDNLVVYCNSDSYAATYVETNGIEHIFTDEMLLGDVNGDGNVNINDVTYIQLYRVGLYTIADDAVIRSDVNRDGSVTLRDATLIQMKLANLITTF